MQFAWRNFIVFVLCVAFPFQAWGQPALNGRAKEVTEWAEKAADELVKHYQHLHTHPEVSFQEKETAAYVAKVWREAGFEVTEKVGGYGIVGLLRNGDGPTVMLRTDLDALPVTEKTNLPYASTVQTQTEDGAKSGVMHACGHDLHITVITGAALYLAKHRDQWRGTLMVIGQPAEERGSGALAMLKDGLFTRFSKPDYALALHVESETPAGSVALRGGFLLANVDSVDIEVFGLGGHGAAPDKTIDPIVQAAELILSLQTIVSREVKPTEPAVITVGSIHGGTKHNIIGDCCHLEVTVRSYSAEVRKLLLDAIQRRAKGVAITYGAPEPLIKISEGTPALENNQELTARVRTVLKTALGSERVLEAEQVMGGEDFSQYGLAGVPIVMYRLGVVAPRRLEQYRQAKETPPSLHSPFFYPDLDGSLETGIVSMVIAAQEVLGEKP
jgi:amidohydrolase